MTQLLKHKDGMIFELLAFDKEKDFWLLKRYDKLNVPTPYVVAHYIEKHEDGISWGNGTYFVTEDDARSYFSTKIALSLDSDLLDKVFEDIYQDTSHFIKFKMACLNEREDKYKNFTDEEWEAFYDLYLNDDSFVGIVDSEMLDTLETRMEIMEDDE